MELSPQQYAAFEVVTPHANWSPTLTDRNFRLPATSVGAARDVVLPSPSSPDVLLPQQYASPLDVTAHVERVPALTEANVNPPPTGVGVDAETESPVPSCPN
jgi:hypothetical protein